MFRPIINISITTSSGDVYSFGYAKDVVMEQSRYKLTDRAIIEIPKNLRINRKPVTVGPEGIFSRGDKVEISMGYAPNLEKRFEGYISHIEPHETVRITCEDTYLLKENIIEKASFQDVTLKALLEEISPVPFEAVDVNLGDLRLTNVSTAQVLEDLRKNYALMSWMEEGVLYCGLLYEDRDPDPVLLRFEHNIIKDDGLTWRDESEIRVQAKAISIQRDNKKREALVGSSSPTHKITLFLPDGLDEATLKRQAEEKLKAYQFTGFEGSLETFGEPLVKHSSIVTLQDPKAQERTGSYWVKAIRVRWGVSGYRQLIELDRRANG